MLLPGQVPSADKPAATPPAASSAVPSFTASKIPSHAPDPVSTSSSASASSKTKYKLLSVYALLPPALRREHWAAEQFNVEKRLHHGYASQVFQVRRRWVCTHPLLVLCVWTSCSYHQRPSGCLPAGNLSASTFTCALCHCCWPATT